MSTQFKIKPTLQAELDRLDKWSAEGHKLVDELCESIPAHFVTERDKNMMISWLRMIGWAHDSTDNEIGHLVNSIREKTV